jgi:lipopolysaccharide export system permease protein
MTILDKYLSREIFRYFFMVLVLVVAIYLAVDFFEKIDNFMEAGLPFSRAIDFFLHSIPFVLSQIIPVGVLLSVLISFGMMNKHNELTALRSCGISIHSLLKPILAIGFLFSFLLFFLSEAIVPVTMTTANRIWLNEVRKEQAISTRENNIWMKTTNGIIHIRHYNAAEKALYKVTLNTFDDRFRLIRRLDAERGVFSNGQWVLFEILEQKLDDTGFSYTIDFQDSMPVQLDMNPDRLKHVAKKTSEMGIEELLNYIDTIEAEGYSATQYRVDFHAKIAFPFVCIILVLAGVGIACKNRLKDGLPASIAYGIGLAFLYWVLNSFCMSLGYGEMLPPMIAAWATNAVFLCFGVIMLMYAEQI